MLLRDFLKVPCSACGNELKHYYTFSDGINRSRIEFPTVNPIRMTLLNERVMIDTNIPEMALVSNKNIEDGEFNKELVKKYIVTCISECSCGAEVIWNINIRTAYTHFLITTVLFVGEKCPFCSQKLAFVEQVTLDFSPTKKCSSCPFYYKENGNLAYMKNKLFYVYDQNNSNIEDYITDFDNVDDPDVNKLFDNLSCSSVADFVEYTRSDRANNLVVFL